jgi:hypothetical protein
VLISRDFRGAKLRELTWLGVMWLSAGGAIVFLDVHD